MAGQHGHALFFGFFELVGFLFLRLRRVLAHLLLAGQILEFDPEVRGGAGHALAREILESGRAAAKFRAIIAAQRGGEVVTISREELGKQPEEQAARREALKPHLTQFQGRDVLHDAAQRGGKE